MLQKAALSKFMLVLIQKEKNKRNNQGISD